MILLNVTIDSAVGSQIINLDHVQSIEFSRNPQHSLVFVMSSNSTREFRVSHEADEKTVMARLWKAMQGAFEGRLNQVGAIRLDLDLRGL